MILIKKKKEPAEWIEYRTTPGVDYEAKPELVKSLCEEQGYICAYCMRRIPCRDKVSNELHRIEHMQSREKHDDLKLSYSNMVICCPGHIGLEDHCDKKKGSDDISFSPMSQTFIDTISYCSDGRIKSSDPEYDREFNETLNLNTKLLVDNRKRMICEVVNQIRNHVRKGDKLSKPFLERMIRKYTTMYENDGKKVLHPYCGVAIYYLKRKLNSIS